MANISLHHSKEKPDGSLKKPILDFLLKLGDDPSNPSLHVEPVKSAIDPRVRTGRVNRQYRAVFFELNGAEGAQHFVYIGTYNHDDAYDKAAKIQLEVNPINGITQLIQDTTPPAARRTATEWIAPTAPEASSASSNSVASPSQPGTGRHRAKDEPTPTSPAPAVLAPSAPAPSVPWGTTVLEAHTPQSLEKELGISVATTETILNLKNEEELSGVLDAQPDWVKDCFIGLLTDMTTEQIRQELCLTAFTESDSGTNVTQGGTPASDKTHEKTDDELTIDGLKSRAAQMEFAYDVSEEELRQVIEGGTFDEWRIFLHPNQGAIIDTNFSSSSRVFGGAGTGKTVVAVHRANRLAKEGGRVLLTTYTRTLAESLETQMNSLNPDFPEAESPGDPGLWISGIDSLVSRVLRSATDGRLKKAAAKVLDVDRVIHPRPLSSRDEQSRWQESLALVDDPPEGDAASPTFLAQEFESVVLTGKITELATYRRTPRRGRGLPLNRAARGRVWEVMEAFRRKCAAEETLTFPLLAAMAAEAIEKPLFDHVLVDEAQDFHAGHWLFLRAATRTGPNDIFLAEDSHQRIYGQSLVLSHFDISTPGRASRRLTLNYRTTRENLGYAVAVLNGENQEWVDSSGELDSVDSYRSARSGPKPLVQSCVDEAAEIAAAAKQIRKWTEHNKNAHIGVLVRTRSQVDRVVEDLTDEDILADSDRHPTHESEHSGRKVTVMTMHNAKGIEFSHVILLGVNHDNLPLRYRLRGLGKHERADELQRERALLYVAASRARDTLMVTSSGTRSELLPGDED